MRSVPRLIFSPCCNRPRRSGGIAAAAGANAQGPAHFTARQTKGGLPRSQRGRLSPRVPPHFNRHLSFRKRGKRGEYEGGKGGKTTRAIKGGREGVSAERHAEAKVVRGATHAGGSVAALRSFAAGKVGMCERSEQ